MRSIHDKVVVITGSSRGIGAAIAKVFASEGAKVVIHGRDEKALAATGKSLAIAEDSYTAVTADVGTADGMKKIIDAAYDKFGVIDVFVNNAGIGVVASVVETSEADYDRTMDTNVRSIFHCFRELLPRFQKQGFGQIINISSGAARIGLPGGAVYAASKAAVNVLSESVANEVRNEGTKVTVLSPGSTDTNFGLGSDRRREQAAKSGKTMLTPEEVAEAVLFLARQNENAFTSMADIRPLVVKR
jgi:NADP-dependent 3-hydroxy acid dehydrogenase YdfG